LYHSALSQLASHSETEFLTWSHNVTGFLGFYPTTDRIFLFSVVWNNITNPVPLYHTTEKIMFVVSNSGSDIGTKKNSSATKPMNQCARQKSNMKKKMT
jgi:hypothetical protein